MVCYDQSMGTVDGDILKAELGNTSNADALEQRINDAAPYIDPHKTKPLGPVTRPLSPSELPKTGALERVRAAIRSLTSRAVRFPADTNDPQTTLARHEASARRRNEPAYYDRVNKQIREDKIKNREDVT